MRWLGWSIVLGLAFAAGLALYTRSTQPVDVDVAVAQKQTLQTYIEERAKTRLPHIYRITMPSAGRILPIDLKEGAKVTKGQVIAQVDPKDLELAVAEAQARVARIEAEIAENEDHRLEQSALRQSNLLLESVEKTVEAAREQTRAGQARYELAETELSRIQRLHEQKAASKEELQRAEVAKVEAWVNYQKDLLSLRSNEAIQKASEIMPIIIQQYMDKKGMRSAVLEKQRAEAVAQLQKVLREQERGAIESPVDGVVLARHVSNARVLPAGELLLEIGRLEELEVEAEILSEDVVHVQEGDEVEIFSPTGNGRPMKGTVRRIYPTGFTKVSSLGVEQQRVLVVIDFNEKSAENYSALPGLGPEYRVRVRIITESKENAVVIPRTALIRTSAGGWEVFVVRDGKATRTPVGLGLTNDREAEILSGVQAGDQVVLAPDANLENDQRVNAKVLTEVP